MDWHHPLGHWLEVHREVGHSALRRLHPCIERDAFCRAQGIAMTVLVHQVALLDETEILSLRILHREMHGGCRVPENHFAGFQPVTPDIHTGHPLWGLNGLVSFCLSPYCNEGEQDGDDGLLVHCPFLIYCYLLLYIRHFFRNIPLRGVKSS